MPIPLERWQFAALRLWARREDSSVGEAVRRAVDAFIARESMKIRRCNDV
ncbi:MAG: hypothetical protein PHF00_03900 [Elusimicrobia bacterium]|nr:hypothetical protein [Elusimicrobiota bacterium]